ncbi:Fibronectin type iii domain-containing protein, partial [Globisporangium splendens]
MTQRSGTESRRTVQSVADLGHADAIGNKDPVSGSGSWVSLSQTITGTGTEKQADLHEKQRVFTRADAGQTISDGYFRLSLVHAGFSLLDVRQHTITSEIPFDASETQMKAALESLDVISNAQVLRRSLSGGAHEWVVLFDPPVSSRIDHGDLPLLILYTETISATWSGSGDQVAIQSLREAELEHVVCADLCSYNVMNVSTGEEFSFRVRARFTDMGWSEWSIASAPLQIPPTRFVSATASHITFKWQGEEAPATLSATLFPILSYHVQQKCDQDLGWVSVVERLEPGRTSFTSASSLVRSPNSSCLFRVAAANANGVGPFSAPSLTFQTLPSVPNIPESPSMVRHPLRFSWKPPSTDGGAVIVRYDVQYRHAESSTWIQVAPDSVDSFNIDRYYVNGIGTGGARQMDGDHGLVVLFPINQRGEKQGELAFFFTGGKQVCQVPEQRTTDPMARIVAIDVYGWGAGSGSGGKTSNDDLSNGSGGAFARGVFLVSPADRFEVYVGGGGRGSETSRLRAAGKGGFHGGGDAGKGDFSGGGGASEVRVNEKTILVAAGGGGGGSTDYCCAHGGGGGAGSGVAEEGNAPSVSSIPLDLIEFQHAMRDEYHFENILGDTLEFTDARARHTHLDFGLAGPGADYSTLATGSAGASTTQGGRAGGASSFQFSRAGKYVVSDANSIIEISAPFIASSASSGRKMSGGKGEDGKDGGGGGGSGYFGGGGGSSFISFACLYDPSEQAKSRLTSAWIQVGERVESFQVKATSSTAVELSWMPPRYGHSHGVEGFVVEMANRSMNEDFRIVRLETNTADIASTAMIRNVVRGLTPSSWYRFRVKVLFRDDSGKYSDVQTIQTRAIPRNVWRRVTRGRFDLQTRIWMEVLPESPSTAILPPAREKHSAVVMGDRVLVFGGRNSDTDDVKASSNDLWEPSISSTTARTTASLRDLETNVALNDDKEAFTTGNVGSAPDMCVTNMMVQLRTTHS